MNLIETLVADDLHQKLQSKNLNHKQVEHVDMLGIKTDGSKASISPDYLNQLLYQSLHYCWKFIN